MPIEMIFAPNAGRGLTTNSYGTAGDKCADLPGLMTLVFSCREGNSGHGKLSKPMVFGAGGSSDG